jgi:hypothetical protein
LPKAARQRIKQPAWLFPHFRLKQENHLKGSARARLQTLRGDCRAWRWCCHTRIFRRDHFDHRFGGADGIARLISVPFQGACSRPPGGLVVIIQRFGGNGKRPGQKIGPEWARLDEADANALRRDFLCERFRKPLDREFGGIVNAKTSYADESPRWTTG